MFKTLFPWSAAGALLILSGCASSYDVNLEAPAVALDTTHPVVPTLAAALPKNPKANTFNVVWKVVPDKTKPNEAILHWMIYNRSAKTLAFHSDRPLFQNYSGVTDAILQKVTAQKGNLQSLTAAGCTQMLVAEGGEAAH